MIDLLKYQQSAGSVQPATKYIVVYTHEHPSLNVGDIVIVLEDNSENFLLRLSDKTSHDICGKHDQYVHLSKKEY